MAISSGASIRPAWQSGNSGLSDYPTRSLLVTIRRRRSGEVDDLIDVWLSSTIPGQSFPPRGALARRGAGCPRPTAAGRRHLGDGGRRRSGGLHVGDRRSDRRALHSPTIKGRAMAAPLSSTLGCSTTQSSSTCSRPTRGRSASIDRAASLIAGSTRSPGLPS
jgi:hypothetical protein